MTQRPNRGTRLFAEPLEPRDTPAFVSAPGLPSPLAVSTAGGGVILYAPLVSTGRYNTSLTNVLIPFPGFTGEVRTASGDVNGDTVPDLIAVTGPGTNTRLTVIDGRDYLTRILPPIDPFGDGAFGGGAFVAVGDIDNAPDNRDEIIVTPDQGGGPRVVVGSVINTTFLPRRSFFGIEDPGFRGGVRVASADVNRDFFDEVVVAAGFGGGPRVAVFNGSTLFAFTPDPLRLVPDFFAFGGPDSVNLRNGVYVAAGDLNLDGFADLSFGGGPGGAPRVFALSGQVLVTSGSQFAQAVPVLNFFVAGNFNARGGVRVVAKDTGVGGRDVLVVGSGENDRSLVRVYAGLPGALGTEPIPFQDIDPFGGRVLASGVYVG